jgi:hypothetical protein
VRRPRRRRAGETAYSESKTRRRRRWAVDISRAPMEVWSAKRLNWSIVTRAHVPRQGGGDARPLRRTFRVLERARLRVGFEQVSLLINLHRSPCSTASGAGCSTNQRARAGVRRRRVPGARRGGGLAGGPAQRERGDARADGPGPPRGVSVTTRTSHSDTQ